MFQKKEHRKRNLVHSQLAKQKSKSEKISGNRRKVLLEELIRALDQMAQPFVS